mgnify:CR=1 FL=1
MSRRKQAAYITQELKQRCVVALLYGGNASKAVNDAACRIVNHVCPDIVWRELPAGTVGIELCGDSLPPATLEAIFDAGLCLQPLLKTPLGGGYTSPNVQIRKAIGTFAGVRRMRTLAGVPSRYEDVDILLVREMTEGTYAGIEHEIVPGVVQTIKVMTEQKCRNLIEYAFDLARRRERQHITLVHKANIMKMSDGMLCDVGEEIAAKHPDIGYRTLIADNAAMQLVSRPTQFDVIVADNLFGDILGDVGAGVVGSPIFVTGVNVGTKALSFQATSIPKLVHNAAGDLAINPLLMLIPMMDLLRHLGRNDARALLIGAIENVLQSREQMTPDMGGTASTNEMADAMIAALN